MYKVIEELVENIENKIIKYRRDFHKYPEYGWTEFRTASLIARRLVELGYEIKLGKEVVNSEFRMDVPSDEDLEKNYKRALEQGGDKELIPFLKGGFTGVVGILKNGEGPKVALRFDIDGLKIQESEEEEHFPKKKGFSSVNKNVMHACGHDGHAAVGLGVAEVLRESKDEMKGTILLIFQPAEEGVRGAKAMVKAKVLDNVEYIISGHIGLKAEKSGQIMCGASGFLATSKIDVVFKGKASHAGAMPERGKNALLSASSAVLNLHSIPRNSKGMTRINVGELVCGKGRNIIPESAYMKIETRGETKELNEYMKKYAERILHNSAEMHGTKVNIEYVGEAESAQSDYTMIKMVKKIADKIYEPDLICEEKVNFGASEDISYMINEVQSNGGKAVYIMFGSDLKAAHHSSNFDFNEKDLKNIIKIYSALVCNILKRKGSY